MSSIFSKCSTSLRPRVGPRPGVSASASQYRVFEVLAAAVAMKDDNTSRKQTSRTVHGFPKSCQGAAPSCPDRMGTFLAPLRISTISFLNTAPLMWNFEQGERAVELSRHFSLSYTVPSQCAEQLRAGTADIGIIPVAAYTSIPDLVVVPDVAIAA